MDKKRRPFTSRRLPESRDRRVVDREYYDSSGYYEDRRRDLSDLASRFQQYRIAKVLEIHHPAPTDRVLDIGCGWGTFSLSLGPKVGHLTGLDFSEKSIGMCRRLLAAQGSKNVDFVCADAQETGLAGGSFDAIIAADVFEHVYPAAFARILDECRRLLKPGGKLVIWTPHRGHLLEIMKDRNIILKRDPSHVDFKSLRTIVTELQRRGFAVRKSYYAESHLPVLRVVERLLSGFVPLLRRRIAVLAERAD